MKYKCIKACTKQANKSSFKQRLGAVIVSGGNIISSGYNKVNCHSRFDTYPESRHAEIDAILPLLNKGKLKELNGSIMYVTRTRKDGTLGMAFPCPDCLKVIKAVGIKRIVYSDDANGVSSYKV